MIGQASGSQAATVFSHNRFGAYTRNRAIPIKRITKWTIAIKLQFEQNSKAWASLTEARRLAWRLWADNNPFIDTLGASQTLTGHQAYCKLNGTLQQIGSAVTPDPPATPAPAGMTALSLTADIGAGDVSLVFTPTPFTANLAPMVWAAVVESTGITYVQNRYKLCTTPGIGQTSPMLIQQYVEARFGALAVGQTLWVKVHVVDKITGLMSAPRVVSGPITTS
jgi:hypothetical protein